MKKPKKETPVPEQGNRPFRELAGLVQKAGIVLHEETRSDPGKGKAPAPPMPQPETEEQLFQRAMQEVNRRSWRRDPAPSHFPSPSVPAGRDDMDERMFQEAVDGDELPPILDHPEYIEGWVGVAGRRFLPNLRNGTYSIQGMIDLHGYSRVEARVAVEDFIFRMARDRSCCVKIVHGRGINSPTNRAILKENLQDWLTTRRMARHVIAYASAPYTDGGVGAIYVLLRR